MKQKHAKNKQRKKTDNKNNSLYISGTLPTSLSRDDHKDDIDDEIHSHHRHVDHVQTVGKEYSPMEKRKSDMKEYIQ